MRRYTWKDDSGDPKVGQDYICKRLYSTDGYPLGAVYKDTSASGGEIHWSSVYNGHGHHCASIQEAMNALQAYIDTEVDAEVGKMNTNKVTLQTQERERIIESVATLIFAETEVSEIDAESIAKRVLKIVLWSINRGARS